MPYCYITAHTLEIAFPLKLQVELLNIGAVVGEFAAEVDGTMCNSRPKVSDGADGERMYCFVASNGERRTSLCIQL